MQAWTVETRQDGSMLSCSLRQILTLTSECRSRNRDSSDQATFSNLLLSNFGESELIVSSVCCSYLTGAAHGVVFCCWSPSASGFDVLCVQRWYSAYLGCNEWLFELLLSFYHLYPVFPFSSDLWHPQGIYVHTTAGHWIFSLFRPFSVNPRDGCARKSIDQHFLRYSDQPVWHQQPFHVQSLKSPFFPVLMLGLNFSKSSSPHLDA